MQLSVLWIAPVPYALSTHVMVSLKKPKPGSKAAAATGFGLLMLIVVFFAI